MPEPTKEPAKIETKPDIKPTQPEVKPEVKPSPALQEIVKPKVVNFQFDRDTTVLAEVIKEHADGTLDLKATVDHTGKFKTNQSKAPIEGEFLRVRPGSRRDPGTWFETE
jgi:hypothetical protein